MQKTILPSVMVIASLIFGVSGFQDAYAVIDCTSAILEPNALYVGSDQSNLHKVDTPTSPPETCLIGQMRETPATPGSFVRCEDIALDHTDGQLYCIRAGNQLHKVDRTADFNNAGAPVVAGTGTVVDTERIGTFIELANGDGLPFINAFEIDSQGRAYIAAAGELHNLDLTTAIATLRIDFNTAFGLAIASSGDLARDQSTVGDMYWTVECGGMTGGALDPICPNHDPGGTPPDPRDRLYRIFLNTPGCAGSCADTLTPLEELPTGKVFAMEIIQPTFNLCYLTSSTVGGSNGFLFETDRNGVVTRTTELLAQNLNSFGSTGNNVGGLLIMINVMSLAVAAAETNAAWLLLFAISGAAVVAYQFKDITKTRKKIKV